MYIFRYEFQVTPSLLVLFIMRVSHDVSNIIYVYELADMTFILLPIKN